MPLSEAHDWTYMETGCSVQLHRDSVDFVQEEISQGDNKILNFKSLKTETFEKFCLFKVSLLKCQKER